MSSVLSDRQTGDLSILDYFLSIGLTQTAEQFRAESAELANYNPDPSSSSNGLLVKKWTSVIRMQKKIMDLEARLAQANEELSNPSRAGPDGSKRSSKGWVPSAPAKRSLFGHRDKINAVRFHPHYTVVASASVDATVKIWDWETGELERTLKGHTKSVTDCDFDSSGKLLATSSNDLYIKLWNVHEEYVNFATLRGHEHTISSVRFLPGDNRLVSASRDHTVRLWDVQTTHCTNVYRPHSDWIRHVVPSLGGQLLLTCANDHTARITDTESGALKVEMRGHENSIECAEFVPPIAVAAVRELISLPANAQTSKVDAMGVSFVMTASRDKTMKLWDALHGTCLWTFVGHDGWVQAIVFHPAGTHVVSVADDHTMRVWDLATGRCVRRVEAHSPFTQCVAWGCKPLDPGTQETDLILNVVATGGTDQVVKIWRP